MNKAIRLSIASLDAALALKNIEIATVGSRLANHVYTGRRRGYITLWAADEIACDILKQHPRDIWGTEYDDAVWFDMHESDEADTWAEVIPFPTPVKVVATTPRVAPVVAMRPLSLVA